MTQTTRKSNKLKLLIDGEPFSKPLTLNDVVRNAISHHSIVHNDREQKITFTNEYGTKVETEDVYFIDFAKLCVENFIFLVFIYEIFYKLQNLIHIRNGEIPNIRYGMKFDEPTAPVKSKVGRNEPCHCGSGQKSKRCCG